MKVKTEWIAIAAIVWLETVALCMDVNGALLTSTITVVAGFGGYSIGKLKRSTVGEN